jgi:undecaprenyl-diphosphatase
MKATGFSTLLARIDAAEYGICRRLNFGASLSPLRLMFQLASRLGDGPVWYALIFGLPVLYGQVAVRPAIAMAVTGMLGVALYTWLKKTFVRIPFASLIAASRVVLGLHYPTDVLVGALLGALLAQLGLAFS